MMLAQPISDNVAVAKSKPATSRAGRLLIFNVNHSKSVARPQRDAANDLSEYSKAMGG